MLAIGIEEEIIYATPDLTSFFHLFVPGTTVFAKELSELPLQPSNDHLKASLDRETIFFLAKLLHSMSYQIICNDVFFA